MVAALLSGEVMYVADVSPDTDIFLRELRQSIVNTIVVAISRSDWERMATIYLTMDTFCKEHIRATCIPFARLHVIAMPDDL